MSLLERIASLLAGPLATKTTADGAHARQLLASLLAMAWFVEARDPYTGGHLWRVSRYARLLAQGAGHRAADVARAELGGFLHDLGKIGVPDAILRKPATLTDDEYAVIRTHPDMGLRMLAGHPLSGLVKDAIHLHHERPDGKGYPLGLGADAIPAIARIVGICDAFDAMTSHRPYRAGMPRDRALRILAEGCDRQFDRRLAERFIALGKAGILDHVLGHSDAGIPLYECPNCGPTLVLRRGDAPGQHIYCRNCSSEFELISRGEALAVRPTGRTGTARDLEPEPDLELIERTVRIAVDALPAIDLMRSAHVARFVT